MAVGSNPTLDSLVAVRNTSPGRPGPCEGNLVAVAGSCGGLMVRHPWSLLEISLSDFRGLATLNINTYLPSNFGSNHRNPIWTLTAVNVCQNSNPSYPMFQAALYAFGCARFATASNLSQFSTGQVLESLKILFVVAIDPPHDGITDRCSTLEVGFTIFCFGWFSGVWKA